jgi:hypothetical protein
VDIVRALLNNNADINAARVWHATMQLTGLLYDSVD